MANFFFWLFRCLWKGHHDGSSYTWPYKNKNIEGINGRMYETIRCVCCNKVLESTPLLPSGRRHMKVSVVILEDECQ